MIREPSLVSASLRFESFPGHPCALRNPLDIICLFISTVIRLRALFITAVVYCLPRVAVTRPADFLGWLSTLLGLRRPSAVATLRRCVCSPSSGCIGVTTGRLPWDPPEQYPPANPSCRQHLATQMEAGRSYLEKRAWEKGGRSACMNNACLLYTSPSPRD